MPTFAKIFVIASTKTYQDLIAPAPDSMICRPSGKSSGLAKDNNLFDDMVVAGTCNPSTQVFGCSDQNAENQDENLSLNMCHESAAFVGFRDGPEITFPERNNGVPALRLSHQLACSAILRIFFRDCSFSDR
jgi:hypothetical protein